MSFERNVFVNCPFDEAYLPLLRPILFVITDLDLTPRIALERAKRTASSAARIKAAGLSSPLRLRRATAAAAVPWSRRRDLVHPRE